MGFWNNIFGKKQSEEPEKSPYLPKNEDPLEVAFAKAFTSSGGYFLYNEGQEDVHSNFQNIFIENDWQLEETFCLDKKLSRLFGIPYIDEISGKPNQYKALVIQCEYLIGNTGKILLSNQQIQHYKLSELPKTIIISAKIGQLCSDVSQGMTALKNKYKNTIPTNITSIKALSNSDLDNKIVPTDSTAKSIYLLLEDN